MQLEYFLSTVPDPTLARGQQFTKGSVSWDIQDDQELWLRGQKNS